MDMMGSMGRTPEPSRFINPGERIGPQPPEHPHPHPHPRKPRRHLLRKLTGWFRRERNS